MELVLSSFFWLSISRSTAGSSPLSRSQRTVSIFSILALRDSRNRRTATSRDVTNTKISLAIVSLFMMCQSVRWIPNMWELSHLGSREAPSWIHHTTSLSHLLTTASSSANWYIYQAKYRRRSPPDPPDLQLHLNRNRPSVLSQIEVMGGLRRSARYMYL